MIELKHITKVYGKNETTVHALNDVSMSVRRGGFAAVMGPSGSGKSTLMNVLGCMDRKVSGEYSLFGTDVFSLTQDQLCEIRNKRIGFVFQGFNLLMRHTAAENVVLPMMYAGISRTERERRAMRLLSDVGLEGRENHTPLELSGGPCQRVAIARALANEPEVLLEDEPTGNLDTKTGTDVMKLLSELNARGRTIILITHSDDIAAYAETAYYLKDGRIYEHR